MSNDKKQKSNWLSPLTPNWRLLLIRAVLVSLFIVGAFGITPIVVNRAKTLKCDWTGFCESTTREETRQKKDKTGSFTETIKFQSGKTLWDWLELAGTLAVPILIAVLGYQFQQREKKRAEEQAELEREIAKKNSSEEAIQAYLDSMAKLLLDKELRKELFPNDELNFLDSDNPVRDVARIKTITILRRLEGDKEFQARILNFLHDAELCAFILKNANLSKINLRGANLRGANLREANLWGANLRGSNLRGANLRGAKLREANLEIAYLWGANLTEADLLVAELRKANLVRANLKRATLWNADLNEANLWDSNLSEVNLRDAKLERAKLWRANLGGAHLQRANLRGAHLRKANLSDANLSEGKLSEAHMNLSH